MELAQKVATSTNSMSAEEKKVIVVSCLGTIFEWYDFFLYGALASTIAKQFFGALEPTTAFIFALLAFAAGFIVRPIGALVFGRLGDLVGRKHTFLLTILIMGLSTFVVGLIPSYTTIGIAAPVILILLRMLQGLALGGEYGAAATYVAEHAPLGKRGAFTAWIQTTSTVGLFLSLLVIMGARQLTGDQFDNWGWRIPFLFSIFLLVISVYMRLSMHESPAFQKIKSSGGISKAPISEAFGQWRNLKYVLQGLFGLLAGQAVVWFTALFYSMFFLTQTLKVDPTTTNLLVAAALLISTPFYVIFGTLSDKIGRKPIILSGCLLAALTIFPIFKGLTHYANPILEQAQRAAPIALLSNPADCSFQFNPTGTKKFTTSCDIAKQLLASSSANYSNQTIEIGSTAKVKIGALEYESFSPKGLSPTEEKQKGMEFRKVISTALREAGYPTEADPEKINKPIVLALLSVLMIFGAMTLGPIAAALVEMFPTRIRYTAISLPYHIGNGWFGGLLPTMCFALVAQRGDIYFGLWYPVAVASASFVIGMVFVKDRKDRDFSAEN
jgi:MFS family permease